MEDKEMNKKEKMGKCPSCGKHLLKQIRCKKCGSGGFFLKKTKNQNIKKEVCAKCDTVRRYINIADINIIADEDTIRKIKEV